MEYKLIEKEHYNIHLIDTDKFKKMSIKIIFHNELKKENITINNLLALVLSRSNKTYNTNRKMLLEFERLYNYSNSFSHGMDVDVMSLIAHGSLLDPKYAEESLLQAAIDMIFDITFNPNVTDNMFDQNSFDFSVRGIKKEIISVYENPSSYANEKLLENMDGSSVLAYHSSGYLEDLDSITPSSLYEYYLSVIKNSTVDIVVAGNISNYDVASIIEDKLKDIKNPKRKFNEIFTHKEFVSETKLANYKRKTSQSILKIGFKMEEMTEFEREMVSVFYSIILGGTFESKLFQNVREKNSLCYQISSKINKHYNIMTITSRISAVNYEKALALSLEEVNNMLLGNISAIEMSTTAKLIKTSLEMDEESLSAIIDINLAKYFDGAMTPPERLPLIEKVTIEDIKRLASKIHIDTVLLLEGDETDEEN